MPFLLLFLLTLACMQSRWPGPPDWLGAGGSAFVTWAGIALLWLAAFWMTRRHCHCLVQDPGQRSHLLRRFGIWRRRHFFALLGFYLFALFLGWGWTIKNAWPQGSLPGLEILLLAPMVIGLVISWSHFYEMERAAHDTGGPPGDSPFPSRWAYVGLQARHNLLLVVPPVFVLILLQILNGLFPDLKNARSLTPLVSIGLLLAAFFSIPLLLRVFLGLKPMPAGLVRDRLDATARRLGFRYSDILVWNTRQSVANAMVTGVLPWMRYIVVTDKLLDALTPEEIEGVFGHEVGHIKHHHMFFYVLFMFMSLVALGAVWDLGQNFVGAEPPASNNSILTPAPTPIPEEDPTPASYLEFFAVIPLLLVVAVYMFIVFGYLSRRCERQADIYGSLIVTPPVFISALEKVADLNGIPREKPGRLSCWQHGTIADRIAFLERMRHDSTCGHRFQQRLFVLKCGVLLGLIGITAGTVVVLEQLVGSHEELWKLLQNL